MNVEHESQWEQDLLEKINWLAQFGKDSENGGITRLLYSETWLDAQLALKKMFEEEGFHTEFDEVGNLFARLNGSDYMNETILTGSHIDTVKNGGLYDGQLGILAGFFALKHLQQTYGQPLRNIEIVSMAEEEGSRFPYIMWGSKNIAGQANPEDVKQIKDANGESFEEAMSKVGFRFKKPRETARDDLKAFIELHIEQGNVLETEEIPIGIVQHIVGQRRYNVEVTGQANHAGTTPMGYRRDAMNAAARMIHGINDLALSYGDPLVATVGEIQAQPGTVNVVPGKVMFSIDARHINGEELQSFTENMTENLQTVADHIGVEIDIDMWMDEPPVPMDPAIVDIIKQQCDKQQLTYKLMHSGAGHDAQVFAQDIPTAMLFVPSRDGISHNPQEYTEPKDLAEGIKALTGALYELGYENELSLNKKGIPKMNETTTIGKESEV
ncbi:allantoate deiminase [Natribacillus halophilus]|uniref:Allantoate deiminase n=1 Tax=Natribacillus halophilus TaxID=549003 RepID=A0A1G8LYR7_9BACI|nr:allantoate deiminase [Natribacillus halophilus]SDI60785.1 allantoate deiminase [Natribacillus halophilus]